MRKFEIYSVMVTTVCMDRWRLITNERKLNYWKGNEPEKESVTDDLESFFEDIRLDEKPNEKAYTYFLPKLTEEELDLVEEKDTKFMDSLSFNMNADVDKAEMEASESDSKFVEGWCRRRTFTIENPKNVCNGCYLQ